MTRDSAPPETVYILGAGAIGLPLAAHLAHAGRRPVAVRTSQRDVPRHHVNVTVRGAADAVSAEVETVSLDKLESLEGLLVVTAKAQANSALARELRRKAVSGPLVLLQNGVGVERPFLETGFRDVYRCVLYVTSQAATGENEFTMRPVTASPIGAIVGDGANFERVVALLNTEAFPFRSEANIEREVWKKAIMNAVFNSVCPLLDVDNGIFARNEAARAVALELIAECLTLTSRLGLDLTADEIMAQLMRVSQGSGGQFISTLQDIRAGRETEIEFLNLEMARLAAALQPQPHELPRVALLGEMIRLKSLERTKV